jgi:hypothetical protein
VIKLETPGDFNCGQTGRTWQTPPALERFLATSHSVRRFELPGCTTCGGGPMIRGLVCWSHQGEIAASFTTRRAKRQRNNEAETIQDNGLSDINHAKLKTFFGCRLYWALQITCQA